MTSASARILHTLAKTHDLQDVLNLGEELLGTPVAMNDPAYQHRGVSAGYPAWDIETRIKYTRSVSTDRWLEEVILPMEDQKDNTPFLLQCEWNVDRLVSKCIYAGRHVGHFTVPLVEKPLETLDHEVIRMLSDACAITYVLEQSDIHNDPFSAHVLVMMEALLTRQWEHVRSIQHHSRIYSIASEEHLLALCVHTAGELSSHMKHSLGSMLAEHGYSVWAMTFEGQYALLVGSDIHKSFPPALLSQIERLCQEYSLHIGYSDVFANERELADYYETALLAVEHVLPDAPPGLYGFNDQKATLIYDYLARQDKAAMYICREVQQALAHDKAHHTSYYATLRAHMLSARDLQRTADMLHVHKNTVIYRLRRIESLLGVNFSDAEQGLRIALSIKVLDHRGA